MGQVINKTRWWGQVPRTADGPEGLAPVIIKPQSLDDLLNRANEAGNEVVAAECKLARARQHYRDCVQAFRARCIEADQALDHIKTEGLT